MEITITKGSPASIKIIRGQAAALARIFTKPRSPLRS
jgi:hypothetical protein